MAYTAHVGRLMGAKRKLPDGTEVEYPAADGSTTSVVENTLPVAGVTGEQDEAARKFLDGILNSEGTRRPLYSGQRSHHARAIPAVGEMVEMPLKATSRIWRRWPSRWCGRSSRLLASIA